MNAKPPTDPIEGSTICAKKPLQKAQLQKHREASSPPMFR
jgi:hypothetical protein